MRAALYARVSTTDQKPENQMRELHRYVAARSWQATEYVDHASGASERRSALDSLLADARRRRFDVLVVWRLDRLGRNLRHLILLLDELTSLGIAFVSLGETIDTGTPAGRLMTNLLACFAEFERGRLSERVLAGLARAKAQGRRLGRPPAEVPAHRLAAVKGLSHARAARLLGVSLSTVKRWRRRGQESPAQNE